MSGEKRTITIQNGRAVVTSAVAVLLAGLTMRMWNMRLRARRRTGWWAPTSARRYRRMPPGRVMPRSVDG